MVGIDIGFRKVAALSLGTSVSTTGAKGVTDFAGMSGKLPTHIGLIVKAHACPDALHVKDLGASSRCVDVRTHEKIWFTQNIYLCFFFFKILAFYNEYIRKINT